VIMVSHWSLMSGVSPEVLGGSSFERTTARNVHGTLLVLGVAQGVSLIRVLLEIVDTVTWYSLH